MAEAKFYAYVHRQADTGEVFYVGKGKGSRAMSRTRRGSFWDRVVAKHGLRVEIVAHFYDEAHAFDHERALIAELRAAGARLVNATDGGEGPSGAKRTEETKKRMSEAMTGLKHRPFSDEAKARMSASAKGRPMSAEAIAKTAAAHRGMKRSPETIARMSTALKGRGLGKVLSPETIEKISALKRGKSLSPEHRAKISEGHKSRTKYCTMTDDHKQKIMAGQAAYWVRRRAEKTAQTTTE